MMIYCCSCQKYVDARLTDGGEIYPHRSDLSSLPFWKCDVCKNYVGCHHKTSKPTNPLGCIPTNDIKNIRKKIHRILDPLWESGKFTRNEIYERLAIATGRKKYHTAFIKSVEEGQKAFREVQKIAMEIVE